MATQYRIGEFAQLSGVSEKTLRFYDEIGLLRPAGIDPRTRYRLYSPQQLEELATILALKDVGLPLAEVCRLTKKPESRTNRRVTLEELKKKLERSIQTTAQSLRWISAALDEVEERRRPIPVVMKRRPAVAIASVRSKVKDYAEIEQFEKELLQELPADSVANLRGVLWHGCADSGYLEGEPFVALKKRVLPRSVYDVRELPSATLACAYSGLDNDSAEQTYDAIRCWMRARDYRLAGPKRELQLGPILEIQFPVEAA